MYLKPYIARIVQNGRDSFGMLTSADGIVSVALGVRSFGYQMPTTGYRLDPSENGALSSSRVSGLPVELDERAQPLVGVRQHRRAVERQCGVELVG